MLVYRTKPYHTILHNPIPHHITPHSIYVSVHNRPYRTISYHILSAPSMYSCHVKLSSVKYFVHPSTRPSVLPSVRPSIYQSAYAIINARTHTHKHTIHTHTHTHIYYMNTCVTTVLYCITHQNLASSILR